MINVRWAEDDPNPGVKKRKAADTASVVEHRVHQKMAAATGVDPYGDDPALQARLEMLQGGGGGGGGGGDGGGGGGARTQRCLWLIRMRIQIQTLSFSSSSSSSMGSALRGQHR